MSATKGSGLFHKMYAKLAHLMNAGGMAGEVADVRQDLAAVFSPLVGVCIEEFTNPPDANATNIMGATVSLTTAHSYSINGAQGLALSPPRNVKVVVGGGGTPTDAPATVTVHGFDVQGNALSELIPGTSGGAATYTGAKCFALVTSIATAAGAGTGATYTVGTGVILGLSMLPKIRAGQALPLIRREVYDGAVVTNGALTLPATNAPFGAYTPNTAPSDLSAAQLVGTADIDAAGLYGGGGTLHTTTLTLTVNGVGPTTVTWNGATNAATKAAMLAALTAAYPGLTVTEGGPGGNKLILTDKVSGYIYSIITTGAGGGGTAYVALGLTGGATTHGGGHLYAFEYEYDGSVQKDA